MYNTQANKRKVMKKIYLAPSTIIVKVSMKGHVLQYSMQISNESIDADAMVKENTIGRSNYNVWSDDWSE